MRFSRTAVSGIFFLCVVGACKRSPAHDDAPEAGPSSTALPVQVAAPCPGCAPGATNDDAWTFDGLYAGASCVTPVAHAAFGACTKVEIPASPRVRFEQPLGRHKPSETARVMLLHQLDVGDVPLLFRKTSGACVAATETAEVTPKGCSGKQICRTDTSKLACDATCKQSPNGCVPYSGSRAYLSFADAEPSAFDARHAGADGVRRHTQLRQGATQVNGHLPAEVVQRIVRQSFGSFRTCYEKGLRTNPSLVGRVTVKFVIGHDGQVGTAADGGSDLPDPAVVNCVVRAFLGLFFPAPEGGIVTVVYPLVFSPGE